MFQKLLIQNFQKWDKLKVEFDPRITVITGPSDAGKSSILRALAWICLNEPDGEDFIRHGANGCTARVYLEDGQSVCRRRGKGENAYYLNEDEFKAFGRGGIPDTIKNLLKVGNVNFQYQKDSPYIDIQSRPLFWFSCNATEVSRQLNEVVDLQAIDESLAKIGKTVRKANDTVDITKHRLTQARETKEALAWVVDADRDFTELETLEAAATAARSRAAGLRELVASIKQTDARQQAAFCQLQLLNACGKVGAACRRLQCQREALQSQVKDCERLQDLVSRGIPDISPVSTALGRAAEISRQRNNLHLQITRAKDARDKIVDMPSTESLSAMLSKATLAASRSSALRGMIRDIQAWIVEIRNRRQIQDTEQREFDEKTRGACPICGKEMT